MAWRAHWSSWTRAFDLSGSGPSLYATVAYDAATGARLWVTRYNGPGNGTEYANALGVSPNGSRVFVTGSSVGSTSGWDYATVAYDAVTGGKLWAKRYNGPGNGGETARALGVSGSTVFVTGWSLASTYDYATVAHDASTGAKLWVKRYDGPGGEGDFATAVGVSPDGSKVFVTGSSTGSMSNLDYATVSYEASTGPKLWAERYNGPGNVEDQARAIGVSPSGSTVFVTGGVYGATYDYGTVAYRVS